ncbi:MAG: hypothetical protein IKP92_01465 [Lachnospiraceae bacterium]|nr:hypothetical protein [Lachnospiraceae bacterium]
MKEEKVKRIEHLMKTGARAKDAIFIILLTAFPFLHISYGLDILDVGYNLLNFETFPDMNRTWAVSTLLANILGHIFTKLPGGGTMLGMNIYCTVLFTAFMAVFYLLLRRYYQDWIVFAGLFLAEGLCWCPKVILYHYLSYYLFGLGTLLFLRAMEDSKKWLYVTAGAVLALNVFVRFPNIVESAMILVLFFYGIHEKKHIWKEFLCCIAGYVTVLLLGILLVEICFGRGSFAGMIQSLFGMTKEAPSYTPKSMVATIFGDYLDYIYFFVPIAALGLIAAIPMILIKKPLARAITVLLSGMCFGVLIRMYYKWNVFNFNYVDYRSFFAWSTFFLMIAIILGIVGLFRKGYPIRRKLLGLAVLLLVFITPIGSNNGLYTAFNNLFLVAVYVFGELVYDPKGSIFEKKKETDIIPLWWGGFAVRCVALMVCAFTMIQGTLFGIVFLFRDESFIQGDFVTVSDADVIAGINTGRDKGLAVYGLNEFLKANNLKNKETICFGHIPGIYYICEEECVMSHSWADLSSFPVEEFQADLDRIGENYPVFIGSAEYRKVYEGEKTSEIKEKERIITAYLQSHDYEVIYENSDYFVALPAAKD